MKNNFLKLSLFVSSFIPLYFLIIVKELMEIINGNLTFNITNTIMLAFNFLLIVLGIFGVVYNYKAIKFKKIEIVSYKNITCQNFLPYFPIFVLFAVAFELEFISMALVYVLILIMLGIVYIKNDFYYINPFLNIIGFSTYEVTYKIDGKLVKNQRFFVFKTNKKLKNEINNYFLK